MIAPFRSLLRRCAITLLVAALAVVLCYFFVDRPVAYWVHAHDTSTYVMLKWITLLPPIVQAWTPAILALLVIGRAWRPWSRGQRALAAGCIAMVLADQCRESLSYVFGRYWPETWIDDNPSLIGMGAYGFHPFHSGSAYGSFPSGHMTRTLAVMAVLWVAWPGGRVLAVLISTAMAVSLIGMNYHFVGDVIAGSAIGIIFGLSAAEISASSSGVASAPRD